MFVSVIKRGDRLQIKARQQFDALALRHIAFVFLPTPLSFCDIPGKQYRDGMQVWTSQTPNPVIRIVRARGAKDLGSGGHPLTELLGEGG